MPDQLLGGVGRVDITPGLDVPHGIWRAQKHTYATGVDTPLRILQVAITPFAPEAAAVLVDEAVSVLYALKGEPTPGSTHASDSGVLHPVSVA